MKRTIIILSFCFLFLFSGCNVTSQIKETETLNLKFTNVSDISCPPELIQHEKEQEQLVSLKENNEQPIEKNVEEYIEEPVYDYDFENIDYNYTDYDYNYDDNSSTYNDGIYYAEYNEMYNEDGPSHSMPGWYDGYLETYYNASSHYLASTWTVDEEGFYKDENDRYVIGVEIGDINPETGEQYQYGDVVQTGKGEAVVYDYGQGAHVHDFAVVW